jgi:hypothetical protein
MTALVAHSPAEEIAEPQARPEPRYGLPRGRWIDSFELNIHLEAIASIGEDAARRRPGLYVWTVEEIKRNRRRRREEEDQRRRRSRA